MYKKQQTTTQSADVFLKKFTEFQIPWDMSDPEIRGVNALGLWDRDLLMSDQPGYIGC